MSEDKKNPGGASLSPNALLPNTAGLSSGSLVGTSKVLGWQVSCAVVETLVGTTLQPVVGLERLECPAFPVLGFPKIVGF